MEEILNKLHLTVKEFSELYEIPYQTVRQWAVGERKMPKYLKKLIESDIERRTIGEQLEIKNDKCLIEKDVELRSKWQQIEIENEKEELMKTLEYARKMFDLRFHVYDDRKELFLKCTIDCAAEIIMLSKKSIKEKK